jgi:hypothetical protein
MSTTTCQRVLEELVALLDIPESAFNKAEARYKSLAEHFASPAAHSSAHDPHIYSQGSFRLGTVNRPFGKTLEYDLDMGCRLRSGITKATHTQKQLKALIGKDLESYRRAHSFTAKLEEKHRCWRLPYQDEMSFHIDAVPSIPEEQVARALLRERIETFGIDRGLADALAEHAGSITDDRDENYDHITSLWRISNSEGFALWFESRMKLALGLLRERAVAMGRAKIDELPAREWKSPLQAVVQLLKRHRDVRFQDNPDSAPISVIITTLAALAYRGEGNIETALQRVLDDMHLYVRTTIPRVPNPVNPAEDFADKWYKPEYSHLRLEENFYRWLADARRDFRALLNCREPAIIAEHFARKFGERTTTERIRAQLGIVAAPYVTTVAKTVIQTPARPWGNG